MKNLKIRIYVAVKAQPNMSGNEVIDLDDLYVHVHIHQHAFSVIVTVKMEQRKPSHSSLH